MAQIWKHMLTRVISANNDHELFFACHRCIEKITLLHDAMLGKKRNHHGRIFRALKFMTQDRIVTNNFIQFGILVDSFLIIETDSKYRSIPVTEVGTLDS